MSGRPGSVVWLPRWRRVLKVISRKATVEEQRRYRTRVRLDDPPCVLGPVAYRRDDNPVLWTRTIER